MKKACFALVLIVSFAAVAGAQYSSYGDSDAWRSQQQSDYRARQAEDSMVRMRQQAEADRWHSNNQLRYANEAAERARQDAENAQWQSRQNDRYSW